MTPTFLYFDLGNVLLHFDHARAARNMAAVAGVPVERVTSLVFEGDLEEIYERGEITSAEFHAVFCETLGVHPPLPELLHAASDMFELNVPMMCVLAAVKKAGQRMGILSNTCAAHWEFVTSGRYSFLPHYFEVHALSYELGTIKPEPAVYAQAAQLAGVAPRDIFFTDDRPENVDAALAAGFQAVPFRTAWELADDMRAHGIRFSL